MLKKTACLAAFFIIFNIIQVKGEVVAPALQYLRKDYPAAFLTDVDYTAKLKDHTRYRLKCSSNIVAVSIGDKENIKIYTPEEDETEDKLLWEIAGPNDVTLKTRYSTTTYIQIYKEEGPPLAAFLLVNKKNVVPSVVNIGDCSLTERTD